MRLMTFVLSAAVIFGFSTSFAGDAERARDQFQKMLKSKAAEARNDWNKALEYYRLARLARLCEYDEDSIATCLRSLRDDRAFDGKRICVAAESRKSACEKEAGEIERKLEAYRKQLGLKNREGKITLGRRIISEANKAAAESGGGAAADGQQ